MCCSFHIAAWCWRGWHGLAPRSRRRRSSARMSAAISSWEEANVNSLDQMTSSTISTRNIAMNIFETSMTRDENNKPILDLAAVDGGGPPTT